jgi:hypothetical protein
MIPSRSLLFAAARKCCTLALMAFKSSAEEEVDGVVEVDIGPQEDSRQAAARLSTAVKVARSFMIRSPFYVVRAAQEE